MVLRLISDQSSPVRTLKQLSCPNFTTKNKKNYICIDEASVKISKYLKHLTVRIETDAGGKTLDSIQFYSVRKKPCEETHRGGLGCNRRHKDRNNLKHQSGPRDKADLGLRLRG